MRRLRLLVTALLCLSSTRLAAAQGTGTIQGTVINGTTVGGPVAGLEVRLHIFEREREGAGQVTTTDAEGRFEFRELNSGDAWTYMVRVVYRDVVYSSGLLSLPPDQDDVTTQIAVYEPTTEDHNLYVERAHIFVRLDGTAMEGARPRMDCLVSELYVFFNSGLRTYVGQESAGGRRHTATFLLPLQSSDLMLDDGALGGRFLSIDGGFVDTEPQWPGTTQVLYSYRVEGSGEGCDLSRTLQHPISALNVLVADAGVEVESRQLTLEDRREAHGQDYLNYVGQDLFPGERLDLRIRPALVPFWQDVSSRLRSAGLPWIIAGSIAVVLALAYPFWRQRRRFEPDQEPPEPGTDQQD